MITEGRRGEEGEEKREVEVSLMAHGEDHRELDESDHDEDSSVQDDASKLHLLSSPRSTTGKEALRNGENTPHSPTAQSPLQEQGTSSSPSTAAGISQYELPKSVCLRVMKSMLPESASIQSDAQLALKRACTVFINYLCSGAHEEAKKGRVKTVTANHVLAAIRHSDLTAAIPSVPQRFAAFQKVAKNKRSVAKEVVANKLGDSEAVVLTETPRASGLTSLTSSPLKRKAQDEAGGSNDDGGAIDDLIS